MDSGAAHMPGECTRGGTVGKTAGSRGSAVYRMKEVVPLEWVLDSHVDSWSDGASSWF